MYDIDGVYICVLIFVFTVRLRVVWVSIPVPSEDVKIFLEDALNVELKL